MQGLYRFAGLDIQIDSVCDTVHQLCKEYCSGGIPCFAVRTTEQDIFRERTLAAREDGKKGRESISWPDGYLETLAVYRKIAEKLPEYDTVLFHGSCVAVDGAGYLFTAKSGVGKSTHTRLWREMLGSRAVMINDDKPLVRINGNSAAACGTPWAGKHNLSSNTSVPLRALCILTRSADNHIRPITSAEAYPMLLQQVYRPANPAALAKTLELIDCLTARVKLYLLGCNMLPEAAELSYHTMKEE